MFDFPFSFLFLCVRASNRVSRHCIKHAPEDCTVVSVGKCRQPHQISSAHLDSADTGQCSSRWSNKSDHSGEKRSPRNVLDVVEGESNSTEDYSSSLGGSTMSESPPQAPKFIQQSMNKQISSPYKFISSFFSSPLRKRKASLSIKAKDQQQPLMKCFSYEDISNSTNNFHPGITF